MYEIAGWQAIKVFARVTLLSMAVMMAAISAASADFALTFSGWSGPDNGGDYTAAFTNTGDSIYSPGTCNCTPTATGGTYSSYNTGSSGVFVRGMRSSSGAMTLTVPRGLLQRTASAEVNAAATSDPLPDDTVAPSGALEAYDTLIGSERQNLRINYSERIKPVSASDFVLTNATISNVQAPNGLITSFSITAIASGPVSAILPGSAIEDWATNTAAADITYSATADFTAPTASIAAFTGPANGDQSAVITLSEVATDFTLADLVLTNATATLTGSDDRYTAVLTPIAEGLVKLSIGIGAFSDPAGNANEVASNEVTMIFDSIKPTVQILGAPAMLSGVIPFDVTIEFNEKVIDFDVGDITVGNGSASNLQTADDITFTATTTPSGAGDVTIDVLAGAATDEAGNGNTAATQVVVGNTTVEDTQKVVTSFMLNRANHILGNQPDLIRFINGGGGNNGGGGPLGNLSLNANEESMELAFSTSLSKIDQAETKAINKQMALAFTKKESENGAQVVEALNTYDAPARGYDVWAEIYGSRGSSGASDSSLWVGYLGAHYFVTPDLIVGALAQVDWADENNTAAGTSADGTGWMIGPYMAGRVAGTSIAYEARAAWGRSDNNVSPLGTY